MKLAITILDSHGGSELGESWPEFDYSCSITSEDSKSGDGIVVIEVEDLPLRLREQFCEEVCKYLQMHHRQWLAGDEYSKIANNARELVMKSSFQSIYHNSVLSSAYTSGAVKGLFTQLRLDKADDVAHSTASFLSKKDGLQLSSITTTVRERATKETEVVEIKNVASMGTRRMN